MNKIIISTLLITLPIVAMEQPRHTTITIGKRVQNNSIERGHINLEEGKEEEQMATYNSLFQVLLKWSMGTPDFNDDSNTPDDPNNSVK